LLGGVTVLSGVAIYLVRAASAPWSSHPHHGRKVNFWFWLIPLILAILNIGPALLLAILMYASVVSTILTFYSYLKKGSYVFTD
jgi:hypothetical protein